MPNVDQMLDKANTLAHRCAGDRVPDNMLAMVLSHLNRHRSVQATTELLERLPGSPFGRRTASTGRQYRSLKAHVGEVLKSNVKWEDAAWIVGWARRLVRCHGGGA